MAESDRRFEIPGIAELVEGEGGLPKVRITAPQAAGEMYLHGGHVTSWKPEGTEEVIFLSSRSKFEHGKAIRGGVPICFPWFGGKADDPKAPAHGFVRAKNGTIAEFDAPGAGTGSFQGTQGFGINRYSVTTGWEFDSSGVIHAFIRTP